jgi:hypothetical protein
MKISPCAEAALEAGMKIFANAIFGILLSALAAFARLGETPDQCQMRYGNSNGQKEEFTLYQKDHFDIAVLFRDGKSVQEIFLSNDGFSKDQVAELLTANSEGSSWLIKSNNLVRKYERLDGSAFATLSGQSLVVTSVLAKIVPGKQPSSGF